VELPAARVQVTEFALLNIEMPLIRFRVTCSGGTYVRSLVHDAGRRLGCGAHVTELRRLASGEFTLDQAVTIERLRELQASEDVAQVMIPADKLLPDIPAYTLPPALVNEVLHGRDFRTYPPVTAARIKVIAPNGQLLAIADRATAGFHHPAVVL
jgi:tRNA pseudouridine55 synthase